MNREEAINLFKQILDTNLKQSGFIEYNQNVKTMIKYIEDNLK